METLLIFISLFLAGIILGIFLTYYFLKERTRVWFEEWKTEHEKKVREDALARSRAVLKGKVGEQIAPFLTAFDYEPSDARFIGSPIDYVIFEGHSENNPRGVTFVDIKTGGTSKLTTAQRNFKKIIEEGKVSWETIRLRNSESG